MRKLLLILSLLAALSSFALSQGQTYPSGTVLKEQWSGGADPCWPGGSSVCYQTWNPSSGSGQSLVSVSGQSFTQAIVLPAAATALNLDAYGTMPVMSAATPFTLQVWFLFTSTVNTSYSAFMNLEAFSGGSALQASFSSNGSSQFYPFTTSATPSYTPNAWHYFTYVFNGSTAYSTLDGGSTQYAANTPSTAWNGIRLAGQGTAGNTSVEFGPITINGSTVTGGWPPSMFADWAGASGSATSALLDGGTHCGGALGGWVENNSSGGVTYAFDNTTSQNLPAPLAVCGASYAGSTGISLKATWSATAASTNWSYSVNTPYTTISCGVYWKTDASASAGQTFTDQYACGDGPAFHICASTSTTACVSSTPPEPYLLLCVEESSDSATIGCQPISSNTWYWVTSDWGPSGTDNLNLYSASLSLLKSFTATDVANTIGTLNDFIHLGDVGGEQPGYAMDSWYANPIFEYADAQFPLLPPTTAASPACAFNLTGMGVCQLQQANPSLLIAISAAKSPFINQVSGVLGY